MDGVYHILEQVPRYGNRTDVETAGRMPDSAECVRRVNFDFTRRRLLDVMRMSQRCIVCVRMLPTRYCVCLCARVRRTLRRSCP